MEQRTGHCQICGRPIKIMKNGRIAHHGFERHQGWNTASCFGAGHEPAEKSNGAMPKYIEHINKFMEKKMAAWVAICKTPPATLTHEVTPTRSFTYDRPMNFNPFDTGYKGKMGYAHEFEKLKAQYSKELNSAMGEKDRIEKKMEGWMKAWKD